MKNELTDRVTAKLRSSNSVVSKLLQVMPEPEKATADENRYALSRCSSIVRSWIDVTYPQSAEDKRSVVAYWVTRQLFSELADACKQQSPVRCSPVRVPVMHKHCTEQVHLWTDGSCLQNPGGAGGIGIVLADSKGSEVEISRGYKHTTNNRMEIMAIVVGLEHVAPGSNVLIHSDSALCVLPIQERKLDTYRKQGWSRSASSRNSKYKVANSDLWERLLGIVEERKLTINAEHVKGHSGVRLNERCDALADNAARQTSDLLDDAGYIRKADEVPAHAPSPKPNVNAAPDLWMPDAASLVAVNDSVVDVHRINDADIDRAVQALRHLRYAGGVPNSKVLRQRVLATLKVLRQRTLEPTEIIAQAMAASYKVKDPLPDPATRKCIGACFANVREHTKDHAAEYRALLLLRGYYESEGIDPGTKAEQLRIVHEIAAEEARAAAEEARRLETSTKLSAYMHERVLGCFKDHRNPQREETEAANKLLRSYYEVRVERNYDRPTRSARLETIANILSACDR